jgi:hypothetical protein
MVVLGGHSTHVVARVIVFCARRKIILIRLVLQSSHLAQLLALYVFGLFKILDKKEKQNKGMRGETRKICRVADHSIRAQSLQCFVGVLIGPDFG